MDSEVKTQEVRRAAWAGQFYPGSPTELARELAAMFARSPKGGAAGEVVAMLAPHAGYTYSGQVAADTYRCLAGATYDTVVVVSPSHTKYFSGVSVYNGGSYETPLGALPTDIHLSKRLGRSAPSTIYLSNMGHTGGVRSEHALEVQLPFLQTVLGSFKLVAVVMGDQQQWRVLGDALASIATEGEVLLVASSDLSHYHHAERAKKLDGAVRAAIERFDLSALNRVLDTGKGEACGAGPLLACMHAAAKLGADAAQITGYAHSGEVGGDESGVVGYLGATFVRTTTRRPRKVEPAENRESDSEKLSEADRDLLHKLARQAVVATVYNTELPSTTRVPRSVRSRRGVFVTLKLNGELRGCIGQVEGRGPLAETVVKMAAAATARDPRFEPVGAAELSELDIEVSVMSPLVICEDPETIEIGRHGLVIAKGDRSGVLLPQVAAENGWERATFLHQICLKAGLPPEAWRDSASTLYTFEAEVF